MMKCSFKMFCNDIIYLIRRWYQYERQFNSKVDMSLYSNFSMDFEKIENLINDILEYYNILKFFNKEFLKYQDKML